MGTCVEQGSGGRTGDVSDMEGVSLGRLSTADLAKASGRAEAGNSVAGALFQSLAVHRHLPDSREQSFLSLRAHLLSYREHQDRTASPTPRALGAHFLHEKD